jgi:aconitate decarboxylase
MRSQTPTRVLAQFVTDLEYEKIPVSVIKRVKLSLLDTLGCGLFGSSLNWSQIIADFAKELGGPHESVVWGRNFKVSASNAALANGTAVHSFEIDDLHKTSIVHPGAVVITPALAIAEHMHGCGGKEFITAIVAGYEIAIRVGMSVGTSHLEKGFHPTGTNGAFGAGAAAGKLIKLDANMMTNALGIAGTQAAGLMAAQYSAMVKRMHAGSAAQRGIYGALLAQKGFTGITNILEADYGGYCRAMSNDSNLDLLTIGLGERYETDAVGIKPYAAGGSTHTSHEAVKSIMEENRLVADMILKITIRATTATYHHSSWKYKAEGVTEAQMNMEYVVAVTAIEGKIFIDQFTEEKIKNPRIVEFSRRVEVVPEPELDKLGPEFRHAIIAEIKTKDGKSFRKRVETAKGSNENPMSKDEVINKFRILAGKVVSQQQVDDLNGIVQNIEKIADVRELSDKLIIKP